MSWGYTPAERDDENSVRVIRSALDRRVNFIDTADIYGVGHNESLVGRAIADRRADCVLATKVGLVIDDLASYAMHRDGSPEHVRSAVDASLRRLNTDVIDLYYLHRIDPQVPADETWAAMAELVAEGKVRYLGLSEVSVAQADKLHRLHPVTAVQSELSLWTRDAQGQPADPALTADITGGAPGDVVGWCADNDVAFVAYSPLGRGFLTGALASTEFESEDYRAHNPRFQAEAMRANQRIVEVVQRVAARHGVPASRVALAWVLAQGEHVFAIPGTKKEKYLVENAAAADLVLSQDDLAELNAVPTAVGGRY